MDIKRELTNSLLQASLCTTREDARKDLLKVIHYGIMALYNHDLDNGDKELDDLGIESEDGC